MYRYVVIEYTWEDDNFDASKKVIGSYDSLKAARIATGLYIKKNVRKMKKKYRDWDVRVIKEKVFFPIEG